MSYNGIHSNSGLLTFGWGMVVSGVLTFSPVAPAATFIVTNTVDGPGPGRGTLREAILNANATPGLDLVHFSIPGAGPHTIELNSELPPVSDPALLDGSTQPGFAGQPLIRVTATNNVDKGFFITAGNTTVRGLVIDGFTHGIWMESRGSNVVQGCYVGTDSSGTNGVGNARYGITVRNIPYNRVGGTNAGDRNLISNNRLVGVYIFEVGASNNLVEGNFIGTTIMGASALGVQTDGVYILGSPGNTVGGTASAERNLISGNQRSGVYIYGAAALGNRVQGNYIGTDVSGTLSISNGADGVIVQDASGNLIGGTNAGAGNVISGNGQQGVFVSGVAATGNRVQGNFIGTDLTGRLALENNFSGVVIHGGKSNLVGGTSVEARNIISGNLQSGVVMGTLINANGTAYNRIEGNFIGVDVTGTNALGNLLGGVSIVNGINNAVGGTTSGARNVVSGNQQFGISVLGPGSSGNKVAGNFIGTDVSGLAALGNALSGILIESPANTIGGSVAAARNVISGNGGHGVAIVEANAAGNLVQGNFIGTDWTGSKRLGNGGAGVWFTNAANNFLGGASFGPGNLGAGNLISANHDAGVVLRGATSGNQIAGNYIGPDVTGSLRLGNSREGILLDGAPYNVIGGVYGNLISGNDAAGIRLTNALGNTIQGNFIGTRADGISELGNASHAIDLDEGSSSNTIGGGSSGGNRIAYSQGIHAGVRVRDTSAHNRVLRNLIFANGGLGIDLGPDGVTPNDPCDDDTGANNLQNYPVLTVAITGGGKTSIGGVLTAKADETFVVQFFANASLDPSGHGEGELFLGEGTVTTSNDCSGSFFVELAVPVPAGRYVTATATDSSGNTSEFASGLMVVPAPTLSIAPAPDQRITLAWPTNIYSYQLEETSSLNDPIQWVEVTDIPLVVTNGYVTVSIGATNGLRFYRLKYP